MSEFSIRDGSLQHQFLNSTAKIQIIGGGFANGKTSVASVKAINIALAYPGCNILLARATYPKLMDTLAKEFIKWCPPNKIKSFPKTKPPVCTLTNGSTINFRYVQQQGKANADTTSNLLSATYDFILIDQMDDPEFQPKDLQDLLGRLRGNAKCILRNPKLPKNGPRWIVITLNPTRNWFYKEYVRPLLKYKETGKVPPSLQKMLDAFGAKHIDDFIQLFTGSTYTNAENLGADYIRTLEATYQGVMKERFLLGEWKAYEGLVYPVFNDELHGVTERQIRNWISTHKPRYVIEGYDHGTAVPACYGLFLEDREHNRVLVDGFYETGLTDDSKIVTKMQEVRMAWDLPPDLDNMIYADPDLFTQKPGGKFVDLIRQSSNNSIIMQKGDNSIRSGLIKVSNYLTPRVWHTNPFTGEKGGPMLYYNKDRCQWFENEIGDYYYATDTMGNRTDKPLDRNDHAMDMTKYAMTDRPDFETIAQQHVQRTDFIHNWWMPEEVA